MYVLLVLLSVSRPGPIVVNPPLPPEICPEMVRPATPLPLAAALTVSEPLKARGTEMLCCPASIQIFAVLLKASGPVVPVVSLERVGIAAGEPQRADVLGAANAHRAPRPDRDIAARIAKGCRIAARGD